MISKRQTFIILFILLCAGSLAACGNGSFLNLNTPTATVPSPTPVPPTPTPPPSAAIVNGEYITIAEFQAELARYKAAQTALGLSFTDEDANKTVLEDLIAQVLLAQGARAKNFSVTESDLQSRIEALADEIGGMSALSAWQSAHGYDDATFRAALKRAAEAAWMRDSIVAEVPTSTEQVHLKQILTYNEATARSVLEQLNAGADFDSMAALYDPVTKGELGWLPKGYLLDANAEEAVFALQAGSYSDIVVTQAGFHIFKVIERAEHPLSPDALLTLQEIALHEWLQEQRKNSDIILVP